MSSGDLAPAALSGAPFGAGEAPLAAPLAAPFAARSSESADAASDAMRPRAGLGVSRRPPPTCLQEALASAYASAIGEPGAAASLRPTSSTTRRRRASSRASEMLPPGKSVVLLEI